MRRHPCGLWHRIYEWLREFLGQTFLETCLAPGGCCSLSIRIRWVLPRQLDPSGWLFSMFIETTCALLTWLPSVLLHGGREAQLLFLIVARGYFSSPSPMRTKALYLASCMPDVVKPYTEQTNDVTPGMSTSMDVSDRKAVTCLSDICHEPLEWLQLPLSKEAQREVTATAVNACIPSSDSLIPACFSFRMAAIFDTTMYRR